MHQAIKFMLKPQLSLVLILLLLMPAMLLRDLNPVNEFNYLAIAADALERGTFFAFYQDGVPYADKPPLYLWLCMLSYKLSGIEGGLLLFLGSVLPFIALLRLCQRFAAGNATPFAQSEFIFALCAVLFMTALSLVARMDMLFTFLIALSYVQLMERVRLVLTAAENKVVTRWDLALPLTIFAALLVKGPYALIFPLVALLFFLLFVRKLHFYFKIFRPQYFLIILGCVLIWGLCVYLDGGRAYLTELFIGQSAKRLSGSTGHPQPLYWYFTNVWYLVAPLALPALYLVVREIRQGTLTQDKVGLASLCFFLATVTVISLPSSKLEIYLLPGLPFLAIYVLRAISRLQVTPPLMLKILFSLNFLPFALIFPVLLFFSGRYPFLQHPYVYLAAFCLSAGALYSLLLIFRAALTRALAVCGTAVLAFIFCLGLAMPQLNPYLGVRVLAEAASADLATAASPALCTQSIAKAENLTLYDARFVVYKNVDFNDAKCRNAALLVGRSTLRKQPDLSAVLTARGGYYIGDNIYVPAPRRN